MSEERRRILDMLEQGKISAAEAERLLDALSEAPNLDTTTAYPETDSKPKPKYLRVLVEDKDDNVDVRVPLQLVRAGIKLGALIPKEAMGKVNHAMDEKGLGINLGDLLKPETIEELIESMGELKVDVNGSDGKVRVFCE